MTEPWIASAVRSRGDALAVVAGDRRLTWAGLASLADRLAAGLHARGVGRGDIVAVRAVPGPPMIALLHASQRLGAALLPLNLRLARPELERILSHACPRLLIDEVTPALAIAGLHVVHAMADVVAMPPKSFAVPATIDPDATLTIVCTSGTTSAPKAVVLTNANHAASAAASRARLGHGAGDVWLATLPLFHVGGLAILVRSALDASAVLLQKSFDAGVAARVLESGAATMVSVVPTMLHPILERIGSRVSPLVRCVLAGGAALSPALGRRALEARMPIAATYGMTEACSQIATTAPGSDDAANGLVGRPLDTVEARIAEPDADGWGEIVVRGPNVTRGYFRNEQATVAALRDGWLHTGDIGRLDGEGKLALLGRRHDRIVTGGENVSPVEVEQVLDAHPDVDESFVFGASDEVWGQRLIAVLVVRPGSAPPPVDELVAWCRERIAGYKIPAEFRFEDSLPKSRGKKLVW